MVSALRDVFKLHVFHATAKTAYLKSIKLKVTHLTTQLSFPTKSVVAERHV
jgi:hypothetical protein